MPTINNATVATGTGLSTAGNGGRKLVKLANGALISVVKNGTASYLIYKSVDNGNVWSLLYTGTHAGTVDVSVSSFGNNFAVINSYGGGYVYFRVFNDAGTILSAKPLEDNTTGVTATGNVSLAINDAGTEIHAAWSSRNSTYLNSFNIRYAKGTIAPDGSVTWGAVEQTSNLNGGGFYIQNPVIIVLPSGKCRIFVDSIIPSNAGRRIIMLNKDGIGTTYTDTAPNTMMLNGWYWKEVFYAGYEQFYASSQFVPQSINGLANGRLWVAWHGKDATDSAKFNIRTSYSDDGGVTWSTPVKQTTGNLYDQTNASLTADSQGKILLTWDAQNATTTQTALKVFSNGTWGATTTLTGDGYTNVSTLFDNTFKLSMTTPPLIRQSSSGVYFSGAYFTGASVTPASGALGDKTASSVLSYTVTPESGNSITSIVEKVNGTTVNTYSNPASLSRTFTIPLANWDALKYYNTQTISVTVTDSNGMSNTQTYTFNKALANDASLLEGAKAAKDGKDRISTKRDGIAGQVGLPPGSTFDAISAQLASGQVFAKVASGTGIYDNTGYTATSSNDTTATLRKAIISNLSFKPKHIIWSTTTWNGTYSIDHTLIAGQKVFVTNASSPFNLVKENTVFKVTDNGAELPMAGNGGTFTWLAFG